ncbi:helix-turn-helix transcriptional regulator [Inediibacterium massiliense]|uniref:helix-turn-helix transcriptional regulator n=1 Tax=Inediibacterium massiliense TaxID=1658111 RepID=UPI0006B4BF7D|nr:helix-turn-helix transcriptional regulator [Inediibacterium massiliense]
MKWSDAKNIIKQDPVVVAELDNLESEYQLIRQIIQLRKEMNMTQEQLAKHLGTKQSNISRLESGNYNTTIDQLKKIAEIFGKKLKIEFV